MKDERINLRVSKKSKKIITENAEKAGLSVSEYCRIRAENKELKARLSAEETKIYIDLLNNKRNFDSISNLFKKKDENLTKEIRHLILRMNSHLNKFK